MIELIGVNIGNLASHEVGHNFGNYHTDKWNYTLNLMDQGGPRGILDASGTGQDGIFGSQDDVDVDFGVDVFFSAEPFSGIEDTLNLIGFGLATGKAPVSNADSGALAALAIEQSERPSSANVTPWHGQQFDAVLLWLTQFEDEDQLQERERVRPPSAELGPDQLDTDSLPPYDVLDPILRAFIEEDRSVDEIVEQGFDRPTVGRVLGMVKRAEYKRRQAPPGIRISVRAFGRDWRYPITSGFEAD